MRAFEAVNHTSVRGILTHSVLNMVGCERGPVRGMGELRVRQNMWTAYETRRTRLHSLFVPSTPARPPRGGS